MKQEIGECISMEYVAITVSVLGLVITAVALYVTISHFKKQLQLNFFADYTKRYQEIILNFPEHINTKDFDLEKLDSDDKDKTLRYMRAYFDLCSEEYYLWKGDYIDNKTWGEWESGIKFAFSKPAFVQAWRYIQIDSRYYPEFTKFVGGAIDGGGNT